MIVGRALRGDSRLFAKRQIWKSFAFLLRWACGRDADYS